MPTETLNILPVSILLLLFQSQMSTTFIQRHLVATNVTSHSITLKWDSVDLQGSWFKVVYWPVRKRVGRKSKVKRTYGVLYRIDNLLPGMLYNVWLIGLRGNMTCDYVTLQQRTGNQL